MFSVATSDVVPVNAAAVVKDIVASCPAGASVPDAVGLLGQTVEKESQFNDT